MVGDPWISLITETLPFVGTAVVGAYFTCSVADCPGFSAVGTLSPLTAYCASVVLTCVMCTAACPEFVTVAAKVPFPPTGIFPKFRLAGFSVNCPTAAVVPAPLREIIAVDAIGSLVLIVTSPVSVLAVLGEYITFNATLPPGATVAGVVIPVVVKGAPVTVTVVIVKFALPVLLSITTRVAVVPAVTFPKLRLDGAIPNCGCASVTLARSSSGLEEIRLSAVRLSIPLALPATVP